MVAPDLRSLGTARSASGSTLTFDVPAGVQTGDIIWIPIYLGDASVTPVDLDGFELNDGTPVVIPESPTNQQSVGVWRRAASSDGDGLGEDDGDVYSLTFSGSTFYEGRAHAFMGALASGDPWDTAFDTATDDGEVANTPAVSITTGEDDETLVWYGTNWGGGTWTPPTGFTETLDANVGVNTAAYKAQAVAGSSGSVVGTCSGTDKSVAWLGALRPIPSGVDPSEGTVDVGLGLAVAAVGSRNSSGAVAIGLGLAVAAAGRRDASGVAAVGLGLAVAGAGRRDSSGVVGVGLGLAVAAAGVRSSRGAAAVTLRLALNAVGTTTSGRPGRLTARSRSQALRARGASVRLVTRGGYADA